MDIDRQLPSVRAIGKPIRVAAVPILMSQQAAMPAPPPVHAPAIAAMVGTRDRFQRAQHAIDARLVVERILGGFEGAELRDVGPRCERFFPAPVRIIALIERSALTVPQIEAIRSYIAKVSALRACGRLKVR